ncbi:hypothetical protein MPSI1_000822 [Malassezia psittaci]|uniref:Uncharacterized protein n=1 Tax=Malassezia psittaci TaxID=1821823 RepID=A0AAF0F3W0_9BASI|nr:hypothetical protein MPSI1_000822 [Malassezia psittaci]
MEVSMQENTPHVPGRMTSSGNTSPGTNRDSGPVPMSLPAILQNPRLRHLQTPLRSRHVAASSSIQKSDSYVGKRRMRRNENSRFLSNPHTVRPAPDDFQLQRNTVRSTFETPCKGTEASLDTISESNVPDFGSPNNSSAAFEVNSALRGQFSISLKDAQQFLLNRQSKKDSIDTLTQAFDKSILADPPPSVPTGSMTFIELLIATARREISDWLQKTVHLQHNKSSITPRQILLRPSSSVQNHVAIVEVQRTSAYLVWHIDDAYNRLAVHCVARVLNCPSFSRPVLSHARPVGGAERHTWILHPNPLVRGKRSRTNVLRTSRTRHTRTDSTSTVDSTTSSMIGTNVDPSPLTAGILHGGFDGIQSPPTTDFEYTSTEEFTGSERGDGFSDIES